VPRRSLMRLVAADLKPATKEANDRGAGPLFIGLALGFVFHCLAQFPDCVFTIWNYCD